MIREICILSTLQVQQKVQAFIPLAILTEKHCAITIHDKDTTPTHYPSWVKPVLCITNEVTPLNCERIIIFLDYIDKSPISFMIFINDVGDGKKANTIMKMIKAIKPQIQVSSLIPKTQVVEDLRMSAELAKQYGILLSKTVAKAKESDVAFNDVSPE